MDDATPGPQRMRYSFESRCPRGRRDGGRPEFGASRPRRSARAARRGYRWWRRYVTAGWVGLQERLSTPTHQPRRGHGGGDLGRAHAQWGGGPSRSARCWATPPRPWARCYGGGGTRAARASHGPRSCATSAPTPESCLHLDTKKLGRFWHVGKRITRNGVTRSPRAGWQHVHVAVDDHSRLAYAEVRGPVTARPTPWPSWTARTAWRRHCAARDLRHLRTRPYTPRTNGKAERLIQNPAAPLGLCLHLPVKRPPHAGSHRLAPVV